MSGIALAQPYDVGEITTNFALNQRQSGAPIELKDFEGSIIVLGFFVHWCQPCRDAVEEAQLALQQHYAERGGNAAGVPVRFMAVNLEPAQPATTDSFVDSAGLDLVVDDFDLVAWDFYSQSRLIPMFAIINGVADSPSHRQWELLFRESGPPSMEALREIIDGVAPSADRELGENPFAGLSSGAGGWKVSPWFGRIQDRHFPWIFHEAHEWLYVARRSDIDRLTFYDPVAGWLYSDRAVYPRIFSFARSTWLKFTGRNTATRQFYDYGARTAIDYPAIRGNPVRGRNGFIFSHAQIPTNQILSGGPPRDGIPALFNPEFVTPAEAETYMEPDDVVLSVTHAGETRAYPFRILNWHEIVNDRIEDLQFAATYCPLCGTALAFNREINGRVLTFGVSGLLYLDNVLMYDHQTESLWSQLQFQSVTGSQFKTPLEFVVSEQMLYRNWLAKYPDGTVLSTNTGHDRNYRSDPYAGYFQSPNPLHSVGDIRDDLPAKAWIYGAVVDGEAIAFSREELPSGAPFEHTFNGRTLSILYDEPAQNIVITDAASGDVVSGLWSFWFAWQAFHRDTELWQGAGG